MKILIVEDQWPAAELLRRYLQVLGAEIEIAPTMHDAMQKIEAAPPFDLITLDLNLPDSRTEATLERVKDIREKNPTGLVVVVTGMLGKKAEQRVIEAGADGLITKLEHVETPKTFFQTLLAVVESAIRIPRTYQRNQIAVARLAEKLATIGNVTDK